MTNEYELKIKCENLGRSHHDEGFYLVRLVSSGSYHIAWVFLENVVILVVCWEQVVTKTDDLQIRGLMMVRMLS